MKTIIKSILLGAVANVFLIGQLSHAQGRNNNNNNQANRDVTTKNKRFWEASVPGGNYMVALDRISAVSKHSYIVSKSLIVHEVNIQTTGAGLVRFYAFDAVGAKSDANMAKNLISRGKELIEQGGSRAGIDTNTTVEKEYPLTTHTHTIEYRLFDEDDLNGLYNSIRRAWREGRGRKFTIN